MLSRYDTTQAARVDCEFAKRYDTTQSAWVDCEFARAYDDTEEVWVDKLYSGYLTLQQPQLDSDDSLQVELNTITLFTSQKSMERSLFFKMPYAWNEETVEFDLVKNGSTYVYFGQQCSNEWGNTVSGYNKMITEQYNGKVTVPLGTLPGEIEGYPVTYSAIYIHIGTGTASEMGYVNISNFKVGGKRYGFTE